MVKVNHLQQQLDRLTARNDRRADNGKHDKARLSARIDNLTKRIDRKSSNDNDDNQVDNDPPSFLDDIDYSDNDVSSLATHTVSANEEAIFASHMLALYSMQSRLGGRFQNLSQFWGAEKDFWTKLSNAGQASDPAKQTQIDQLSSKLTGLEDQMTQALQMGQNNSPSTTSLQNRITEVQNQISELNGNMQS